MADTQVTFSIPEATIVKLNTAVSRRGRPITIDCPLYQATIPDPAWHATVDDGSGNQVPNPTSQGQIANTKTLAQFTTDLVVAFCTQLIEEDIVSQGDVAKIAAMAQHETAEEANRAASVAQNLAAIDRNVNIAIA